MKVKMRLPDNERPTIVVELNKLLADEYILAFKTRKAHWNVEGSDFYDKHAFFDSQYRQLDDMIDHVAKRIRTLNYSVSATLKQYLEGAHLVDHPEQVKDGMSLIKKLLVEHEELIRRLKLLLSSLADNPNEAGTRDFLSTMIEKHEKMAWTLRSHIQ